MCEGRSLAQMRQINCHVGPTNENEETKIESTSGAKPKRKSRSSRRRLHAMMSNMSLHFSDTDSEGELSQMSTKVRTMSPAKSRSVPRDSQAPTISVTLENSASQPADTHWDGLGSIPKSESRNSFTENLTDVDEIYGSDAETVETKKKGLTVIENVIQGETDIEDMSNDEGGNENDDVPLYVAPTIDIFRELGGGTITTKEGDGPFSVELRRQMTIDEPEDNPKMPHAALSTDVIHGGTDSEDIDVSEAEDEADGAWGQRDLMEDLDLLAASQVIMKNTNKMENLLSPRDDDGVNEGLTDVEDIE